MRLATRKSEKDRLLLSPVDHLVTAQKLKNYQSEIIQLNQTRIPAASEVARTAAMGDLSENAAYQFAKQHLRSLLNRITKLENLIAHAVVINSSPNLTGKVMIGNSVTVSCNGLTQKFQILGSQDAKPQAGRISHSSPLGQALLGKLIGDQISLTVANKTMVYTIQRVE